MIQLNDLTFENTNLIEIYFIQPQNNFNKYNLDFYVDNILDKYKFKNKNNYNTFYLNNLSYTYDLTNDSQIVSEKVLQNINNINNNLILTYYENKYPTYIFPCTNDIDHSVEYSIQEYKINNRISLNIRNENNINSLYLQYKHSDNVDIEKMETLINSIITDIKNNK